MYFKNTSFKTTSKFVVKGSVTFSVPEIIEITGFTEGIVKHAIADARKNMIRVFKNRCAFVNKEGVCHQCTTLKGVFNAEQDAHIKAQQIKLVKEAEGKNQDELLNLRLELVKGVDPLHAKNTLVNTYMLENLQNWKEMNKQKILK